MSSGKPVAAGAAVANYCGVLHPEARHIRYKVYYYFDERLDRARKSAKLWQVRAQVYSHFRILKKLSRKALP